MENTVSQNYEYDVSVVMPCLNEEETLGTCVSKAMDTINSLGYKGEVVVSDNGSTDRSIEIAESLGARVVHQELKGYGNAYLKGLSEAKGRFIVMGDSDDSYDFTDLKRFVEPLKQEGFDMVMGTRLKGEIKDGAMPWHHKYIGNPLLSWFLNLLYRTGISDSHCGMRSFTKDAFWRMNLRCSGMEFASEMVINASKAKLKIKEIPITLHPDGRTGAPHLRSFRDGWRHLRFMILYSPNFLYLVPATVFFSIGLILLFTVGFTSPVIFENIRLHVNTMVMAAMFVLVSVQSVSFLALMKYYYSLNSPLFEMGTFIKKLVNFFTFERGLITSLLLIALGTYIDVKLLLEWQSVSFGNLDVQSVKQAILGLTAFISGSQLLYFTFALSIIRDKNG